MLPQPSSFESTLPLRRPVPARLSLRRQLIYRFGLVFVIVALLGGFVTVASYRTLVATSQREAADHTLEYVKKRYEQLSAEWLGDAEEIKTQIDFLRIFAGDDPDRWQRLSAYFVAVKGKGSKFDSVFVLRADGSLAFSFGDDRAEFASGEGMNRSWHVGSIDHAVHEHIAVPLWLGLEGRGHLMLLQEVDTASLRILAPPDVTLYLVLNGKVIASSEGSADIDKVVDAGYSGRISLDGRIVEQRVIPCFGTEPEAPRIVMRVLFKDPLTTPVILFFAATLLALFSLILWLVIGRWTRGLTDRVGQLSMATSLFAQSHGMGEDVQQALDEAGTRPDEIGVVAASCRDLILSVLEHDEEHFAYLQTLDILEEGVVELDRDGHYLRMSPGWIKLTGCDRSIHGTLYDSVHPDDVSTLKQQFAHLFSGEKTSATGRVRLRRADAGETWAEYRFVPGAAGADGLSGIRGVLRDVTQSYVLEKHISHMALHDALTGLPNRVLLEDRAKIAMRMAGRTSNKVALGFIDLDHFKDINDHFGHKTGDQVLVTLATALRACLRSGDTLARWGGDEFVVLLSELSTAQDAREVAAKLIEACDRPIVIDGTEFNVTVSTGVAIYPDDADTIESLLSQADRAMFFAKEQGRNNVRFFSDLSQKEENRKALYIQNRLAAAIKNRQIQAWFQPVVDVGSRRIIACEALARWHDDTYGWVPPATFIPMAENLGLIGELGQQVWQGALTGLRRWREMGLDLKMAVNVSRRQLFTPSFTADLLEDLERAVIPALCVELEITESVAMEDAEHTSKRLRELAAAGFGIVIDDFGTGYSSLSQLHDMPATKLKIDISFVRRVHEAQGAQLVSAIIHMARAFSLPTIAEGVEDAQTAATLQSMGVDFLQGYHFGRPMVAEEFERLLLAQPAVTS